MSQEFRLRIPALPMVFVVVLACGCSGGTVTDGPGPVAPVDTTKPPVVQRGRLTVRVTIDPADASLAATAGIAASGLTVRLQRPLSNDPPRTATVNSAGVAQFDSLLDASYQISVDRPLSEAERSRLPEAERDVGILAAGTSVGFSPPAQEVQLSLVASRRGSLVISELYGYLGPLDGTLPYNWGSYVEVYNNSDTTAHLDGVLLGVTWGGMHSGRVPDKPCATFNVESRLDSTTLWLAMIQAFPGTGRDYPIRAGEAKVVALDALNHGVLGTNQFDLSSAPFEQHGTDADVDNPFVPDMVNVRAVGGALGRGYPVRWGQGYAILAARTVVPSEPSSIASISGGAFPTYRVDRRAVLDVFAVDGTPASQVNAPCLPFISSVFDRDVAQLGDYHRPQALARKSLGRTSNGVEILQRTRTSSRDFEYREPLLRSLRK